MSIIQDMSETIDDLRFFFEPVESLQSFDVRGVINKCHKLLAPTFEHDAINLEIIEKQSVMISGYGNDYAQVVLQLLNNSRDALNSRSGAKNISITIDRENDRSLVKIADNGGGIDADIFDHIFDPYVTSQFKSSGKGLSLYMAKIVIEKNMNGILSAANVADGAVFKIII